MVYKIESNNQFSFDFLENHKEISEISKNKSTKRRRRKNKNEETIESQLELNLDFTLESCIEPKKIETKLTNNDLEKLLRISNEEQIGEIINGLTFDRYMNFINCISHNIEEDYLYSKIVMNEYVNEKFKELAVDKVMQLEKIEQRLSNEVLCNIMYSSPDVLLTKVVNGMTYDRFMEFINEYLHEIKDDNIIIKIIKNQKINYLLKQETLEALYQKYEYMYGYAMYKAKLHIKPGEEIEYKHHGHCLMSKAISTFDDSKGCKFKSFLFCVLYRGYISKYFQTDKYKFKEVPVIPIIEGDDYATFDILLADMVEDSPFKNIEIDNLMIELQNALTDIEYQCVMARVFGMSYKEISEMTGLSIKQVDNKIQRIRKSKVAGLN